MKIDIQQKENEIIEYRNKINKNNIKIVKLKKNIKEIKTVLDSIQVSKRTGKIIFESI